MTKENNWQIISMLLMSFCHWQAACTYHICAPSNLYLPICQRSDYKILQQPVQTNPRNSNDLHLHGIRVKVWKKNNICGFTDNKLLSAKPCLLFLIQTLPPLLWAGAISHVSFCRICLNRLLWLCNPFSSKYSRDYQFFVHADTQLPSMN